MAYSAKDAKLLKQREAILKRIEKLEKRGVDTAKMRADWEKKWEKSAKNRSDEYNRRATIGAKLWKLDKDIEKTNKQIGKMGTKAVIGAENLASKKQLILKTAKMEFDQVIDLSGEMVKQVQTANDINDAHMKIGTTLFDTGQIEAAHEAQAKKFAEDRFKLMSGQTDLSKTQVEEALKGLDIAEKDLRVQTGIVDMMKRQDASTKNLGKGMSDIKDQAKDFGAQIMAIAANPMVALGAGLLLAGKYLYDMFQGAMELKTELGISDSAAAGLQMQISETATAFKMAGVGASDVKDAALGLMDNFGGVNAVTPELLTGMAQMKAELGVSGTNAANLMVAMKATGAASQEAAFQMAKSVGSLAQAEGVAPGQVMQDLAQNTEAFASFAKDGGMNVAKAAIQAKKLGINFDTSVKIADNLLNFESSIQQQMEAEILLGRQLNLDKARQLALSGDIEGLQREVLKNVGTEADFNAMNVLQRRALAQSIGVSVTELSKMVANQSNLNSMTKSQTNSANLMGFLMKIIRDLGQDLLEAWKVLSPILMVALVPLGLIVGAVVMILKGISAVVSAMNTFGNAGTIILGTFLAIWGVQKLMGTKTIAFLAKEMIMRTKIGQMIAGQAGTAKEAIKKRASGMFKGLKDKMPELPKKPDALDKDSNPFGFVEKINPKKILAGAAAMLIVAAALFVTAKALQEFGSVEWSSLAKAGVALLGLVVVLAAIGAIMMSGVGAVAILAGAAAMLVIAASLLVLGFAIQAIGTGFGMLAEGISSFTPLLTTLVPLAGGIFILAGAFGALGIGMGALAIGALALLPALPVLMALSGIGMLGMALAGGGEETGPEPPPITDMGVTNDKLDGVISAIGQLQADNRVLMESLNSRVKNLGTE